MGKLTIHFSADFGFVTEDLPITLLAFGGQGDDSYAIYDVSDVRCAPKPFGKFSIHNINMKTNTLYVQLLKTLRMVLVFMASNV
jgi:hypothetical protein